MKKLLLICLCSVLFSGCLLVTGNDKTTLNRTAVWANALYVESKHPEFYTRLSQSDISNLLDYNRQMWFYMVGSSEGKTVEEIQKEFDKIPMDSEQVIKTIKPGDLVE